MSGTTSACWLARKTTGSTHAALYFIKNQQGVVSIAQIAQVGQICIVSHMYAAFALNRLDENGNDLGVLFEGATRCRQIVERYAHKIINKRSETFTHPGAGRGAEGQQGTAMESIFRDQYFGIFYLFVITMQTGHFQCTFIGFGARVAEKRMGHAGQFCQMLRQCLLQFDLVDVGGMY